MLAVLFGVPVCIGLRFLLFVTDEAGDLLLKSGGLRLPEAPVLCREIGDASGLCRIGGHSFYAKTVRLEGKVYHFFLDFDRLCTVYGIPAAGRAAEGLFDLSAFSAANAQRALLAVLFGEFLRACPAKMRARIRYDAPPDPVTVRIPPNAFSLVLSLIVRLCRGPVRFSFAGGETVSVFAEGMPNGNRESVLCRALLREVCGAAGFSLDCFRRGGRIFFSVELAPVDPARFGLKAGSLFGCGKNFYVYAACFFAPEDDIY